MKIYVQDHGVYGVIIVVAEGLDSARQKMKLHLNYKPNVFISVHEIEDFEYSNYSDM